MDSIIFYIELKYLISVKYYHQYTACIGNMSVHFDDWFFIINNLNITDKLLVHLVQKGAFGTLSAPGPVLCTLGAPDQPLIHFVHPALGTPGARDPVLSRLGTRDLVLEYLVHMNLHLVHLTLHLAHLLHVTLYLVQVTWHMVHLVHMTRHLVQLVPLTLHLVPLMHLTRYLAHLVHPIRHLVLTAFDTLDP